MKKIRVKLKNGGDRSYDIVLGSHILGRVGYAVKKIGTGRSVFIITDSNVGRLYARKVIVSLRQAGFKDIGKFTVPAGEKSKTLDVYGKIIGKLYSFDKHRDCGRAP